ncbi:MAG: hypothetical protein SCK28_00780 [Bacillota bacterium]|nr:hypothetical protein [Bacillota bacterium]
MELFIWSKGLCYRGKVKDLKKMLAEYPQNITVQELITQTFQTTSIKLNIRLAHRQ